MRRQPRRFTRLLGHILGLLAGGLFGVSPVDACPACVGPAGAPLTLVQQVVNSDLAVQAMATAERRRFVVRACFKGELAEGTEVLLPVGELPQGRIDERAEVILGRDSLSRRWRFLGTLTEGHSCWLQVVGRMERTADLALADWINRTRFFLDSLEDSDPLVVETSVRELSRTPYAAMRECRTELKAADLLRTLAPDRHPERESLTALLLGIVGGPTADRWLAERTAESDRQRESGTRAALLVARLEQQGESGLPAFLAGEILAMNRRDVERRAALLALSVQGTVGERISRTRVLDLYELLLEQRPELADMVAADCLAWQERSLLPALKRITESGALPEMARESLMRSLEMLEKRPSETPSGPPGIFPGEK